ncbi:MAG: carbohydrate kinase, FGGY [Clostridiales bacterium 38_11]|nr:MAG: carbohydrate kinase, FGGY [Clostridiales bacterium 38_11]
MGLLLAIDIGTTNLKVAAFTIEGACVGIEKKPTIAHYDVHGNSIYKPTEIWKDIASLLRIITSNVNQEILAISASSMSEAIVPLDCYGQECFDIITWFDTRAQKEAKEIVEVVGKEKLFEITGLDPNPIFPLCKILWMKRHHPDVFQQTCKWLQMTDYILYKLSGVMATDYSLASRTMAFDVCKNEWSDQLLELFEIDRKLFPEIVQSGSVMGTVTKEAADITGLSVGTSLVMGGNDHPCASLPAGVLNGNKILDSSGTAEAFIYVSPPQKPPLMKFMGQRTCRYLDKDRYALWGGIISSGASFEWAYKLLTNVETWGIYQGNPTYAEILSQVQNIPPGSNGVLFIPHLRGSGAPYWDPNMTGCFLGLKTTHTQQDLLRAVMEGLAFQARMIVNMHEQLAGSPADALCVVGGSGKNFLWQQIKADVLQKPIEICDETEATLLGAAILAGVGVGIFKDMTTASIELSKGNQKILPNSSNNEIYQPLYEIYCDAYKATEDLSHRLQKI